MSAIHVITRPLIVANARHITDMAALCASIGHALTRLSATADFFSLSDRARFPHRATSVALFAPSLQKE